MSATGNKNFSNNSPSGVGGMEYNFRDIEKKWQEWWVANKVYKVPNESARPKYYVLDMFPYPSGTGLHVGHPLGYIASDIYARFKRLKGYNVLHPMGYDAFGLPAEQYAIDHGIHPAVSTAANIKNFRSQLDKIGFSFDWEREVNTSKPEYYKWTQWIFLQLFDSWYNSQTQKAERINQLIQLFEKNGSAAPDVRPSAFSFTAKEWKAFDEKQKMDVLMEYRLAYCGYGEVNWCEALGTVLANDEVINGVSERGGYPVVKKKLRQWYLRITEYADRLLEGLERVDFSDAMKEMQGNWIGKSSGAEIEFEVRPPLTPPKGENTTPKYQTAQPSLYSITKILSEQKRKNPTHEEQIMWQLLRANKTGFHIRRQHIIGSYIVDFACLDKLVTIEIDAGYHGSPEIQFYNKERTAFLKANGFTELRFTNEEVRQDAEGAVKKIIEELSKHASVLKKSGSPQVSPLEGDLEGALKLKVYTTRPDTIFGVDFMVIAPEHELVEKITSDEQRTAVEEYIAYVKSRSERERMAEKKITGIFTGGYVIHPFSKKEIPVWISEYVLAGYGTGAIMAVPCGDERDHKFARHFAIPITNIIGSWYNGEEANPTKEAILENSDFLNGIVMKEAIEVVIKKIEEMGIGVRKVNYKMRDAAFSRQRYWGEPFPIVWRNGIAYPLDEKELPLILPDVEKYSPGPDGEGPLANIPEWYLIPGPSPQVEKGGVGAANVPKYNIRTPVQYELARMMRKDHTEAEKKLWELLRGSKTGAKFRRQHPVEAYIVDFVSLQDRLIVEADGGYHNTEEQKKYDEERTRVLNDIGFKVIRFSNEEILKNPYSVKDKIKSELSLIPDPSPQGEKGASPLSTRGEGQGVRETTTMPGYAGSSWYFLRYMDPHNEKEFCNRKASDYWGQADLYIGGTEHAVGHLLYSRMWTKCLYDLGYIGYDEPYKKLVNQGMIQGVSQIAYRTVVKSNQTIFHAIQPLSFGDREMSHYISADMPTKNIEGLLQIHIPINYVDSNILDLDLFYEEALSDKDSIFYTRDGYFVDGNWFDNSHKSSNKQKFFTISEVEKMSKRYFNVVNPDDIVLKYGADTFRMYEMFLGPVEMSKPWDTKGIEGVHRFLRKLWRLFYSPAEASAQAGDELKGKVWTNEKATEAELKVLHRTIKKIEEDTERFSFNTGVSGFMIAVNELTDLKCYKKEILEPLLILLAPYAPHIAEELYYHLQGAVKVPSTGGGLGEVSILNSKYPKWEEKYLIESSKEYPISVNGKLRTTMNISLDAAQTDIEQMVLENDVIKKWLEGKPPKKIIFVKGKMVNVVI